MTAGLPRLPVLERLDLVGLLTLRREWDAVIAASAHPSPFQSWSWVEAWLDTVGTGADLEVVTARDPVDGELLGVAPFVVVPVRRYGVGYRALRLVAAGVTGAHGVDLPVAADHADAVAPALWDALCRQRRWDLVDLVGLSGEGVLAGMLLRRRADAAMAAPIPVRHIDLRRLDPGADAAPPASARLVVDRAEARVTLDRLAGLVPSSGWAARRHTAFAHPSVLAFHRRAVDRLLDTGRLRLWRLDDGDRTAAVLYAVRFGDVVACHSMAADPPAAAAAVLRRAALAAADEEATRFVLPADAGPVPFAAEERTDLHLRRPVGSWGRLLWAGGAARRLVAGRRAETRPRGR